MPRGKKSIDTKFQEKLGKGLWDLIREHCQDCTTKEEACEVLELLTNNEIKVNPQTLWVLINKNLENGTLSQKDFFVAWAARKRKKYKKGVHKENGEQKSELDGVLVRATCQHCNHEKYFIVERSIFLVNGLCIRGSRCPDCNLWATFEYFVEIDGKKYSGKEDNWEVCNPNFKRKVAKTI